MTPTEPHTGEKSPGSSADPLRKPGSPAPGFDASAESHAPYAKSTRGYMQILSLTSVGIEMAISVVLGLFAGQWLDRRFGTEPLFLIILLLLGCAAAGKSVYRAVQKADRMADGPSPSADAKPPTPTPNDEGKA